MRNAVKEVYWRLTVLGVSGAGGHAICPAGACPCGAHVHADGDRNGQQAELNGGPALHAHHFWDCVVAEAVLRQVYLGLPQHVFFHRAHVWLCIPPDHTVQPCVWRAVCLAAVAAMEDGCRSMWRAVKQRPPGDAPEQLRAWMREAVQTGCASAAHAFWTHLQRFVRGLQRSGRRWQGGEDVGPDHAFIAAAPGGGDGFSLRVPALAAGVRP